MFIFYPVLRNPEPDKHYIVDTNALAFAISAISSQDFPNRQHPITFFSKSLLIRSDMPNMAFRALDNVKNYLHPMFYVHITMYLAWGPQFPFFSSIT